MKKISSMMFCWISVVLLACGGNSQKIPNTQELKKSDIGLLYSTENENESKIEYYTSNGEKITELVYPYGGMGHDGYINSTILDGVLYECPLGIDTEKDLGIVLAIDLNEGDVTEYEFGRTNITGFTCDKGYVYATSNLNAINYIDRYDRRTGKIDSINIDSKIVMELITYENTVIGFVEDSEGHIVLSLFDFQNNRIEELYDFSDELSESPYHGKVYKNNLFFAQGDYLYRCDLKKQTVLKEKLIHNNGFNLVIGEKKIYVGCTDIFSEDSSTVEVYDLDTLELVNEISISNSIQQMEIRGDNLYIGNNKQVIKYDISKGNIEDMKLNYSNHEEYYTAGFYVKEENNEEKE